MRRARLGDCCEIVSGATPKRNVPDYWGSDVPWVTPKDLSNLNSKVLEDAPEYISEAGYRSCSSKLMPAGSVLFSSRAPIGLVAIAGREMCTNQGFKSLIPGPDVQSDYLYYWLKANREPIAERGNGATFKEISGKVMAEIEIPLPPLPEQKRIAKILDAADALRAKRRESLAQLDALLQSTFLEMFGDPVENPKGWPMCQVGELVSRLTNGYVGPTRDIYVQKGVPYLLARHIHNGEITFDGKTFVSEEFTKKHKKSVLKTRDVLLVQSGHIGSSAVVPEIHAGQNCHAMIVITPIESRLAGEYLHGLFDIFVTVHFWDRIKTGISVPHLNCRDVRKILIPVPPLQEQERFAQFVLKLSEQKSQLRGHLFSLESLFASLQQRAFAGQP